MLGETARSAKVAVIAAELKCSVLAVLMVVVHEAMPSIAASERRIKIFLSIILHLVIPNN